MKKVAIQHFEAIKISLSLLSQGKFLMYFIPGVIITGIFLLFDSLTASIFEETITAGAEEVKWYTKAFSKVGSIMEIILVQMYIFMILTVLSPINTFLSEKVDSELTKKKFPFNVVRFINDFFRMVFIVIISLFLQFIFIGIWWLICWITGVKDTIIYDIVAFLISAFFFGFSFFDYSLERYGVTVGKSLSFAFSNIWAVILTGSLFKLLYHFPYIWDVSYIGITIAPVITTMVSTVVYLKMTEKHPLNTEIELDK